MRKGDAWGDTGPLPPDAHIAASDAAVSTLLPAGLDPGEFPPVGLTGGDLRRSLGGRSDAGQLRRTDTTQARIDVGELTLDDGSVHRFVAHVIARRPSPLGWWFGDIDAYMNTSHIGRFDVAPKAHPGDGLIDHVQVRDLAVGQRWQARRRLITGTHVPHPNIVIRRTAQLRQEFAGLRSIYVDGQRVGRSNSTEVTVLPSVLLVAV